MGEKTSLIYIYQTPDGKPHQHWIIPNVYAYVCKCEIGHDHG